MRKTQHCVDVLWSFVILWNSLFCSDRLFAGRFQCRITCHCFGSMNGAVEMKLKINVNEKFVKPCSEWQQYEHWHGNWHEQRPVNRYGKCDLLMSFSHLFYSVEFKGGGIFWNDIVSNLVALQISSVWTFAQLLQSKHNKKFSNWNIFGGKIN